MTIANREIHNTKMPTMKIRMIADNQAQNPQDNPKPMQIDWESTTEPASFLAWKDLIEWECASVLLSENVLVFPTIQRRYNININTNTNANTLQESNFTYMG